MPQRRNFSLRSDPKNEALPGSSADSCIAFPVKVWSSWKANYTKYEYRIAMRDGKKLFTSVYVPKDDSERWPIMFDRTPYSVAPYGIDNYRAALGPSEKFARDKFIFVYQDVRGQNMSEGTFRDMTPQLDVKKGPQDVDESSDTYDTIDWLVKNIPNNNGRVGMWGISLSRFLRRSGRD